VTPNAVTALHPTKENVPMTAITTPDAQIRPTNPSHEIDLTQEPSPGPLQGNPALVGIPTVIAGAVGLGLVDIGFVPAAAAGACLPSILTATAIGLLITTVWAAALGQNATSSIFAVFFGFYASYAALSLGLTHNWFGVAASAAARTEEVWFICWLVTIGVLTLASFRLPLAFTALFVLVDIALALLLASVAEGSPGLEKAGAVVVFAFIAEAIYLYLDVMNQATGGKALPLGKPLLHT
jgi:succinate-acetate transporter protein